MELKNISILFIAWHKRTFHDKEFKYIREKRRIFSDTRNHLFHNVPSKIIIKINYVRCLGLSHLLYAPCPCTPPTPGQNILYVWRFMMLYIEVFIPSIYKLRVRVKGNRANYLLICLWGIKHIKYDTLFYCSPPQKVKFTYFLSPHGI